MKILVDADACPVKNIIVDIAKKYNIVVAMYIDTSHEYKDGYSEVITIAKGSDAVDIALVNDLEKGYIVVTQDYGLAAIALGKGARVIDQNGRIYTADNIDRLLFERHVSRLGRKLKKGRSKHKKRTKHNDVVFREVFDKLCFDTTL